MSICPGSGPLPSDILLCGEKPGTDEIRKGKPFIGKSGEEQSAYLARHHLSTHGWYLTNVVKEFVGDRPPSEDEIEHWAPELQSEVGKCNPKLIIAVGAISARYFLGSDASLEIVHGIPCRPGEFDKTGNDGGLGPAARRAPEHSVILPIYHPALGFRDPDARSLIAWDYAQVAEHVRTIKRGEIKVRQDPYAGREQYREVGGEELADLIEQSFFSLPDREFAIDTEGSAAYPFSLQVSWQEGTGYFLRYGARDYKAGLEALKYLVRNGAQVIGHNLMHDIPVLRVMGLELRRALLYDTMYAAYISRIEAFSDSGRGAKRRGKQGLKPLAWRWNGTRMMDWEEVTGDLALESQLRYLDRVTKGPWKTPPFILTPEHDGTVTCTKPSSIQKRAAGILRDWTNQKRNKDGSLIDIEDRWNKIEFQLRDPVEHDIGKLPIGSISQVYKRDRERAIRYACADSDQTLRLSHHFRLAHRHSDQTSGTKLQDLMCRGMLALPAFEEMQANGMPASESYFRDLSSEMWTKMMAIGRDISKQYYDRKPFNPKSPLQTRLLLKKRGLKAAKQNEDGEDSTAQKSIQHLEAKDPAIALVGEWRRHEHIRDAFCEPILESIEREKAAAAKDRTPILGHDGNEVYFIRCQVLTTRTATRRSATKKPNLQNIPQRTILGLRVREGFKAPAGYLFGAWDLSQIEFRILTHYSEDKVLIGLFNSDKCFICDVPKSRHDTTEHEFTRMDIHAQTASWVFGIPRLDALAKKVRSPMKTVNYGMVYLQSGMGMAETMRKEGLTEWDDPDRCEKLIKEVHKLYPGIPRFIDRVQKETWQTEVAYSEFGMPRHLPGIRSRDRSVSSEALRHAMSQRIQGTAQDMLQNSMIWLCPRIWDLQDQGQDIRQLLQVHDELVSLYPKRSTKLMDRLVIHALTKENGLKLRIPVEAEGHTGENWSDLK